jgi:hypothetical protein
VSGRAGAHRHAGRFRLAEAVIGTIRQNALPLPVDPPAQVGDLASLIAENGARLMIVAEQPTRLLGALRFERAVPVDGRPEGIRATVVRFSGESDE